VRHIKDNTSAGMAPLTRHAAAYAQKRPGRCAQCARCRLGKQSGIHELHLRLNYGVASRIRGARGKGRVDIVWLKSRATELRADREL
jgi:hypothetical protein